MNKKYCNACGMHPVIEDKDKCVSCDEVLKHFAKNWRKIIGK